MASTPKLPLGLRGLVLSATELKAMNPEWADAMIEDYLANIDNIQTVASVVNQKQDILTTISLVDTTLSPYTIPNADKTIVFDTTSGDIVANLPPGLTTLPDGSSSDGRTYRMTNVGTSGNKVVINPDGTELLFGTTTENIYDAETLILTYSNPDGWW